MCIRPIEQPFRSSVSGSSQKVAEASNACQGGLARECRRDEGLIRLPSTQIGAPSHFCEGAFYQETDAPQLWVRLARVDFAIVQADGQRPSIRIVFAQSSYHGLGSPLTFIDGNECPFNA